jgi:hypothetical protein
MISQIRNEINPGWMIGIAPARKYPKMANTTPKKNGILFVVNN